MLLLKTKKSEHVDRFLAIFESYLASGSKNEPQDSMEKCAVSKVSVVSLVCCRPAGNCGAQLFSLLSETLSEVFNTHISLQVSISAQFAIETIGQGKTPVGT